MKIEEWEIGRVVPYEFNNRTHDQTQIARIAKSINEFGFNQPIVVDENNVILVGHGRLFAALQLKLDKVPVLVRKGLSEKAKRAYRILDNKLQNDSTWSFDNLELELGWLEDNQFDLEPWGLDALRDLFREEEPETHDDEFAGTISGESYIKLGDIIELGPHRVMCGDSRTPDFIAATLSALITDPPYGVSYVGKTDDALTIENDELDEDELEALWRDTVVAWLNHLADGGAVYCSAPSGPKHLIFANVLRELDIYRQQLIWVKDSMVLGHSDYHYKHEPIFYGWKPGKHYFTEDRTKTSVLEFDRPKASREHPTMKPLLLWAELIKNSTKPGDCVGDPFLGSGTTLIACDQLKRVCYGSEVDPKYCQVIIERYQKHCQQMGKPFLCKINGEQFNPSIKKDDK